SLARSPPPGTGPATGDGESPAGSTLLAQDEDEDEIQTAIELADGSWANATRPATLRGRLVATLTRLGRLVHLPVEFGLEVAPYAADGAGLILVTKPGPAGKGLRNSKGSGVVVHEDGQGTYFAANKHVVDGARSITVKIGEHVFPATLVAMHPTSDLALIRIDSTAVMRTLGHALPALALGTAASQAEPLMIIGFPAQGQDPTVAVGRADLGRGFRVSGASRVTFGSSGSGVSTVPDDPSVLPLLLGILETVGDIPEYVVGVVPAVAIREVLDDVLAGQTHPAGQPTGDGRAGSARSPPAAAARLGELMKQWLKDRVDARKRLRDELGVTISDVEAEVLLRVLTSVLAIGRTTAPSSQRRESKVAAALEAAPSPQYAAVLQALLDMAFNEPREFDWSEIRALYAHLVHGTMPLELTEWDRTAAIEELRLALEPQGTDTLSAALQQAAAALVNPQDITPGPAQLTVPGELLAVVNDRLAIAAERIHREDRAAQDQSATNERGTLSEIQALLRAFGVITDDTAAGAQAGSTPAASEAGEANAAKSNPVAARGKAIGEVLKTAWRNPVTRMLNLLKAAMFVATFVNMLKTAWRLPVTGTLIKLNALAFAATAVLAGSLWANHATPLFQHAALTASSFGPGDWWQLLSSGFLHYGPIHLAFNMLMLAVMGTKLEPAIGKSRFLGVYLASMLAGGLAAVLFSPAGAVVAGASGAVFGLMGALAVTQFLDVRTLERQLAAQGLVADSELKRSLRKHADGMRPTIVANLLITVALGLSLSAHLGGLIAGAALTAAILTLLPTRPGGPSSHDRAQRGATPQGDERSGGQRRVRVQADRDGQHDTEQRADTQPQSAAVARVPG
ncbi:MAG: rhomboid family intramembrane serine protease, partial [Pseudonocardiales bacterium]|nr:rhomboid family intramembrane serine protease [Pseudonocardiales bacterium]